MTSSENLPTTEPWTYKTTPFADTWLSEAAERDNETLTKAHQQSLSSDLSPLPPPRAATSAQSDPDATVPRRRSSIPVKGPRRKSRASKRATTTFITADPANFRQMVQQVTGVRFSSGAAVLRPEPQRVAAGRLPSQDTSALLLEPMHPPSCSAFPAVMADGGGGFEFESFSGFPTLESWN